MPIQVLQRQEDPSLKLIGDVGRDVSKTILEAQAQALTKRQLKLLEQNAANDVEKEQYGRMVKVFDAASDLRKAVKKGEVSPEGAAIGIKQLEALTQGNQNKLMELMAMTGQAFDSNMKALSQDIGKTFGPQAGEATSMQVQGSELLKNQREAAILGQVSSQLDGGQPAQPTPQGYEDPNQQMSVGTPYNYNALTNQARAQAVGGQGLEIPNFNIGGMTIANPAVQQRMAYGEARARKQGEMSVAQPISDTQTAKIQGAVDSIDNMTQNILLLDKNKDTMRKYLGPPISGAGISRATIGYDTSPGAAIAKSIINSLGTQAQVVVRALTGAQAGFAELNYLISLQPNPNMPPEQIMANTYLSTKTVVNTLKRQIPVLKAANKDTTGFTEILTAAERNLDTVASILDADTRKQLDSDWSAQSFPTFGGKAFTQGRFTIKEK